MKKFFLLQLVGDVDFCLSNYQQMKLGGSTHSFGTCTQLNKIGALG
jgi:hypothetical protein